jgi:hypothetical protein
VSFVSLVSLVSSMRWIYEPHGGIAAIAFFISSGEQSR